MPKHITIVCLLYVFMAMATTGLAEKATELYIPIGQSPGLWNKAATTQGKVEQVNVQSGTLMMSNAAGKYAIKSTNQTIIYLDKSKAQQPNAYGSLADCKVGDLVEVKWKENNRKKTAEWIKVQKTE